MKPLPPLALATALVALGSCSRLPMPEPKYEGVYGQELKRDTRRATLYDSLEVRLFIHATWLRPELVAEQAATLSQLRAEPPDLAAARLQKMQADDAAPVFYMATYTPLPGWNDFDSKTSVWRIALEGGPAGEAAPVKVTRYEGPFNAELVALYPYIDDFDIVYRVEFPPGSGGTLPKLLLAGALGKVELSWDPQ